MYVFTASLTHKNIETLNPLDVSQWRFFVVPTTTLNRAHAAQHSITLKTLRDMAKELTYGELHEAVPSTKKTIS